MINLFCFILSLQNTGSLILWIIIGCSLFSVSVFIERMIFFKTSALNNDLFIIKIKNALNDGHIVECIQICEEEKGAVAGVVKAALLKAHRPLPQIESAMETAGLIEIAKLEKNGKILSMIAYVAPLIGLLGTVLGFIEAFSKMRQSGLVDISATELGGALEYALVTTAAGLVVAIPSVLGYNFIVSTIEKIVLDMQVGAKEMVDLLLEKKENYEI